MKIRVRYIKFHIKLQVILTTEWIFDIVNNQRNKIDVDKFDYLKRDPHMAGFKHAGFDY